MSGIFCVVLVIGIFLGFGAHWLLSLPRTSDCNHDWAVWETLEERVFAYDKTLLRQSRQCERCGLKEARSYVS